MGAMCVGHTVLTKQTIVSSINVDNRLMHKSMYHFSLSQYQKDSMPKRLFLGDYRVTYQVGNVL